jgi:capsular polysaccharide transport system permease protein
MRFDSSPSSGPRSAENPDPSARLADDDIAPPQSTGRAPAVRTRRPPHSLRDLLHRVPQRWLLPLAIAIPAALVSFYFAFWASDVYVSESRFVVRSPERRIASGLGTLLQGVGIGKAQDDSYAVRDFILSRDALKALDEKVNLREAYASRDVDIFARFTGLDPDDSFEALHRYYQGKVDVQADPASSIVVLTVRAFRSKDAFDANRVLLEQSEALVNRLNERARQDLIRYAQNEVADAEKTAKAAAVALSNFRNAQSVVDPERQAAVQLQQVAKLQDELIATNTQLAQLRAFTPGNPQIASLQNRSTTLQGEIQKETARVAGGHGSLANKAAGMQQLTLEAEFASKQLASAMAGLESARNEAQRQQVYLERIAQPSLPDVAQEPRRLRRVFSTLVLALLAWGILGMLLAGAREHQG